MPRYSFYQDTKVETWERSHFDVTANSYEEAVAIVKACLLYTSDAADDS